jgi:hypothetical protein
MARRKPKKPPYQVFVSHATADKWIAKVLCEKLEAAGATTFRDDRDINGGDDIPEKIWEGIKQSRELLLVLTPESVSRPWIHMELGVALSNKLRIVVVRCHMNVEALPESIKSRKSIHLNDFDDYLRLVAEHARGSKP